MFFFDITNEDLSFDSSISTDISKYSDHEFFSDEFNTFDFDKEKPKYLAKKFPKDMDLVPKKYKEEALKKVRCIEWIEERIQGGWTAKNIEPLLLTIPSFGLNPTPSWRSLARWSSQYRKSGRKISALVPKYDKRGRTLGFAEQEECIEYGR